MRVSGILPHRGGGGREHVSARRRWLLVALGGALALAGCGRQSTLDPQSDPARQIATAWWIMLVVATVVFAGACFWLVLAWARREPGLPFVGERESVANGLVLAFGIAIPSVILIALFVYGNVGVIRHTDAPPASSTAMTVEVVGNQWWWRVIYPGTAAVTANEIHIPARTRVSVVTRSDDVIHSFWVPQLNRKVDSLPGHPNRVLLYADKPGVYRGQCAEFCGPQHAHMAMTVYADPPDRFRAWLANMARPRVAPVTPEARRGEQVFLANQCASCHTIRGTSAKGLIGPDLTHLRDRQTLAALTIPNRPRELAAWIRDPQNAKPDNKMPTLNLSAPDARAIVDYLETLR